MVNKISVIQKNLIFQAEGSYFSFQKPERWGNTEN